MATLKRSWDVMMDDDDGDEPSMGRQTLPVAHLPENFDGQPKDGLQYLWTVRRDAKTLPFYTRVENPYETDPGTVEVKAQVVSKPRVSLPSEEWRTVFIKRFRNLRKNSLQPTIGVQLPVVSPSGQAKSMPEKRERDKWWAFINGRPECEWNPDKVPKKPKREPARQRKRLGLPVIHDLEQYEVPITDNADKYTRAELSVLVVNEFGEMSEDHEEEERGVPEISQLNATQAAGLLPTPFSTPQPEERFKASEKISDRRIQGGSHQPTPALLKNMDSRYCMHLLMYFTYWITQHLEQLEFGRASTSPFLHLSQNHARWIFALLSRVDEHLTSDELSTLRALSRACIAFIKYLNKNTTCEDDRMSSGMGVRWVGDPADAPLDERACWMVVAIITDFWGQKDLWWDAESTLNGP